MAAARRRRRWVLHFRDHRSQASAQCLSTTVPPVYTGPRPFRFQVSASVRLKIDRFKMSAALYVKPIFLTAFSHTIF